MHPIRSARRVRGLTIIELAQLSGVRARTIAMFEQGMLPLDTANAEQLANALALPIALLMRAADVRSVSRTPAHRGLSAWISPLRWVAFVLFSAALLVGASLITAGPGFSPVRQVDASTARRSLLAGADSIVPTLLQDVPPTVLPRATLIPTVAQPVPTSQTTPVLTPASDGSPRGCPLLAEVQRVVITQGYGEGTHLPVSTSGAIDLAIDADGDGYAEPDATRDIVILATHSGTARVWLNSWPGGNVIRVIDEQSGWSTLYAHLAEVSVSDGQPITLGMPLGIVGSTGMSSGPHLHYEIWHFGENRDPTNMAPCWRR